ncbi:hypothetical protein AK812_SmicGene3828 [Symbiodinium microadriaticum]|uniref:Thiolase C-terminal domain-containing protein n=1 Tax=Symbiodinium microadriaticum TaxID=2951 RepID=A0A1Q9EY14_SYMMI|nr:hypothetical protein AK812_SmicGene3828 [Symbiodinium microadriaticum]
MPLPVSTVRIVGHGMTKLGKLGRPATELMQELDGLIAVPSLSDPHFMEAHNLATQVGLLPRPAVRVRTIDTGGAGPVSGLLEAVRMVKDERCQAVAVVAGDAVSSLNTEELAVVNMEEKTGWNALDRQAARHPLALTRTPRTLEEVLNSRKIAPATNLLECARRADGGAAIIVANSAFMDEHLGHDAVSSPDGVVGERLGPMGATGGIVAAARAAFSEAQLLPGDIDWFGLYDCYPVCFIRALEACGVAPKGSAGEWVEQMYERTKHPTNFQPDEFPVNTHGGLLAFGAPWEVPAMYNIIEACEQLSQTAGARQLRNVRRALVYGNGGIFSHSAVAILAKPVD